MGHISLWVNRGLLCLDFDLKKNEKQVFKNTHPNTMDLINQAYVLFATVYETYNTVKDNCKSMSMLIENIRALERNIREMSPANYHKTRVTVQRIICILREIHAFQNEFSKKNLFMHMASARSNEKAIQVFRTDLDSIGHALVRDIMCNNGDVVIRPEVRAEVGILKAMKKTKYRGIN